MPPGLLGQFEGVRSTAEAHDDMAALDLEDAGSAGILSNTRDVNRSVFAAKQCCFVNDTVE